ncbi:MAG: hypothetical protein KGI80_02430 [Verrucomicrobiota bacterium]|nr:hypothetical protein [Verrucomicrobiota bacterium]
MKITLEVLSIPPFLSTTWENVRSLSLTTTGELRIHLVGNSKVVEVPSLNPESVSLIFETHARYLDKKKSVSKDLPLGAIGFRLPMPSEGGVAEPFPMQHNPEQAGLPPLPPAVLKKVTSMAEALGLSDFDALPTTEPGCHCLFCQVVNAFRSKKVEEEDVSPEDLKFRDWEVSQIADHLYSVQNPIDREEQYRVFLGEPLGCTCGQKNCEHIRAVLKT